MGKAYLPRSQTFPQLSNTHYSPASPLPDQVLKDIETFNYGLPAPATYRTWPRTTDSPSSLDNLFTSGFDSQPPSGLERSRQHIPAEMFSTTTPVVSKTQTPINYNNSHSAWQPLQLQSTMANLADDSRSAFSRRESFVVNNEKLKISLDETQSSHVEEHGRHWLSPRNRINETEVFSHVL